MNTIVYIIPTYNERENILDMLETVNAVLNKIASYKKYILVVDDNSPDKTAELVRQFQKKHPMVKLLSGRKEGLGAAMIRGYKFAMKKLHADIVVSNEADFSYSPSYTPLMIKKIEKGIDVVVGSRKISSVKRWPFSRRIVHWVANTFFAAWIAGVGQVQDHNSLFKAIGVKGVLDQLDFQSFPKGFSFFNYLIFRLSKVTPRIYEITTPFRPRTRGESKVSFKPKYIKSALRDATEYIHNCFRIRLEKLGL
jgi:dolichol-phosphate mannosyltransferase